MKYFDHLPVEIRMMVFDHLVTDKFSLGIICLISHNWRIITQNSYSWKLWVNAIIGKKSQPGDRFNVLKQFGQDYKIFDPIYDIHFAPNAIVSNHIKIVLTKKFMFSFLNHNDILKLWYCLFPTGNLQLIQVLQKIFHITENDLRGKQNHPFRWSCRNGHINVVKYIHKEFELTIDDVRAIDNYAFRTACGNGHLEVVKYIHNVFHFTIDDVLVSDNYAFCTACGNGHLKVIKYLHTVFGLTTDNVREDYYVIRNACGNGHVEVIKYLHTEFGLIADDVRLNNNHAMRMASDNGHLEVVKYLHTNFNLTGDDARIGYDAAINGAIMGGHLTVVKYLHEANNFCVVDNFPFRYSYKHAVERGHWDVVEYIRTEFNINNLLLFDLYE